MEIVRELGPPYSVPALPEDKLPEGAHRIGDCPDPTEACLLCRVFGSLTQPSLFRSYTPPLVDDPDHKLDMPQEVNHVLIRIHARNVHRPDGSTMNFNQQYFAGTFVTYLSFLEELPEPAVLGFLVNCLEQCDMVGAAKAWGAGKLFLRAYTLEQVDRAYKREWDGATFRVTRHMTITPLKTELEQALDVYEQWVVQQRGISPDKVEEEVVA